MNCDLFSLQRRVQQGSSDGRFACWWHWHRFGVIIIIITIVVICFFNILTLLFGNIISRSGNHDGFVRDESTHVRRRRHWAGETDCRLDYRAFFITFII